MKPVMITLLHDLSLVSLILLFLGCSLLLFFFVFLSRLAKVQVESFDICIFDTYIQVLFDTKHLYPSLI